MRCTQLAIVVPLLVALGLLVTTACSEGGETAGTQGGGGGVVWSTSSSEAASGPGQGGGVTTGSTSGNGASTSATGGTSAAGGAGGGDDGGSDLVVLGGGLTSVVGASFANDTWTAGPLTGTSAGQLAVVFTAPGEAVGVLRSNATGGLQSATWTVAGWGAFADISAAVEPRAGPAIAVAGDELVLVYHGSDFKHYFSTYDGAAWSNAAAPVTPDGGAQSFGGSPAAITALDGDAVIAFPGDDGTIYVQRRSDGGWEGADPVPGSNVLLSVAIAALTSGPELLVVWVNRQDGVDDHKLFAATRAAGTWSTPARIHADAFTHESPRIAALAGGDALVAFRGTNGEPYTLRLSDGSWGAPTPLADPNPAVTVAPAICAGALGADAELVYVGADFGVHHTRLDGATWSAPTSVGGQNLVDAAIGRAH